RPAGDLPLEVNLLAINRFAEAGYEFIGLDHFAKPGEALAQARRDGTPHLPGNDHRQGVRRARARRVPTTVMPTGVEHAVSSRRPDTPTLVPTTVMPTGVEHTTCAATAPRSSAVPTTVMPTGVEHHLVTVLWATERRGQPSDRGGSGWLFPAA